MAEQKEETKFVEVICKCTGKTWRFATGMEAKFVLKFINGSRIDSILINTPVTYIESVKDGEVPVIFGPNSVLVNYGEGWKLQQATETTTVFSRGMPDDYAELRQTYVPPGTANVVQTQVGCEICGGPHTFDQCTAADPNNVPMNQAQVYQVSDNSHSARRKSQGALSPIYIGKILLVFILMFLIGAAFTLLLDNLPQLLSRYNLDQ